MIHKNLANSSYGISLNLEKEILFQIQSSVHQTRIRLTPEEAELIVADLKKWIEKAIKERQKT